MPEDLLIDILARLPVKSLQRFKCVCKYWYALIGSPDFISNHYHNCNNRAMLLVLRYVRYHDILGDPDPDRLSDRFFCDYLGYDITSDDEFYTVTNSNRFAPIANISSSGDECKPDTNSNNANTTSDNAVGTHPNSFQSLETSPSEVIHKEFALAVFRDDDILNGQPQPPPHEDIIDIIETYSAVHYLHNITGPVDGLFLLHNGCGISDTWYNRLALWNLATTELRVLPLPEFNIPCPKFEYLYVFGFGLDPLTNNYKVVWIPECGSVPVPIPPDVALYSLHTNSWRHFNAVLPSVSKISHSASTYLNGACYWLSLSKQHNKVASFDMGSDVFQEIEIPDSVARLKDLTQDIKLVLHNDDSLALLVYEYIDLHEYVLESIEMWVMKHNDDGEEGFWTRLFTLGLGPLLQFEKPHGFWKNNYNEIFFTTITNELVLYSRDTDEITQLGVQCDPYPIPHHYSFPIFIYKESLVSVGGLKKSNKRGKLHAMVQDFVAFRPIPV